MNANDPRYEAYSREFGRLSTLQASNITNQDGAFIQLSAGILAALATFGKPVILANVTLGILVFIALFLTITQVLLGFFFSNRFLNGAKTKLTDNYRNNVPDLGKGISDIFSGKVVEFLNVTTYISFFLAIAFLFSLVVIYVFSK